MTYVFSIARKLNVVTIFTTPPPSPRLLGLNKRLCVVVVVIVNISLRIHNPRFLLMLRGAVPRKLPTECALMLMRAVLRKELPKGLQYVVVVAVVVVLSPYS